MESTCWVGFMSEVQSSLPAVLELPEVRPPTGRKAPAALQTCLIVSTSARRTQLFVRAAHAEHWATIVCTSADEALRQTVRQRVQLALVDLQSAPASGLSPLKQLVEQLAARRMLIAVCGRPEDLASEVWSRQLGVWMYLPGIDCESDISLLCAEARGILEKLAAGSANGNGHDGRPQPDRPPDAGGRPRPSPHAAARTGHIKNGGQ
jgi:hypothetical protein